MEPEAGEEVVLDAEEEAAGAASDAESESTEETEGAESFIEGIEEVPTVDEAAETESESTEGDICSYVYTGQEIAVALPDGETVTGGTASAVNVGEYTVELVDAEGVTQELAWEITPATLTATCYYAEVKLDAEDSTEAETETSEDAADIEVAMEVTGFVNGEDETTAAGYVTPQYTQPSTLEEAALLTAFGGEADNYTFIYADSVYVGGENEIATCAEEEVSQRYSWIDDEENPTKMADVVVTSTDSAVSAKLTADCKLSLEEITDANEYKVTKALLNEKLNNAVLQYGYLKLSLKDAEGNAIDLNNQNIKLSISYTGVMNGVDSKPTGVYGVSASGLTEGSIKNNSMYPNGMKAFGVNFESGVDKIAVVAEEDFAKECPLEAGTYTITANLTVKGANNVILPGVQVFLGNPDLPPVSGLTYNGKLVVDKDKKMTLTLEHFNSIFQIVDMQDGEYVHIQSKEYVINDKAQFDNLLCEGNYNMRHDERVDKLVLTLDNANGEYEFGACTQSPLIVVTEDTHMTMHLQVDFTQYRKGFDESKGDIVSKPFSDEKTGATVDVRTTDTAMAEALENAKLEVKEKTSVLYAKLLKDMYYDGTLQYQMYDVTLKDAQGKELDLENADNTEVTVAFKTGYTENRIWRLDENVVTKLQAVSSANKVSFTGLNEKLGSFVVVDNASATQYANVKATADGATATFYIKQGAELPAITENTDMSSRASIQLKKTTTAMGDAYIPAVTDGSGEAESSFGNGTEKLSLYVPYDSSKKYYLVKIEKTSMQIEELDASDQCGGYVFLTIFPESGKDSTLLNAYSKAMWNACQGKTAEDGVPIGYVLASDKLDKVASMPTVVSGTLIYSGEEQAIIGGGAHYKVTEGEASATDAGKHTVKVAPEDGYTWLDGTDTEVTISKSITKQLLYVKFIGETVVKGSTPKYEVSYKGFVNGEDENTAADFVKATVAPISTEETGSYSVKPKGASAKNYRMSYLGANVVVVDSADKIIVYEAPELLENDKYVKADNTYIVGKDESEIAEITAVTDKSDEIYTYEGELSSNELGMHKAFVSLKDGYYWSTGERSSKLIEWKIMQVVGEPAMRKSVEYNGEEQTPFDEATLKEFEGYDGRWKFSDWFDDDMTVPNDQYVASEVGEYTFKVTTRGYYCWDETGSTGDRKYTWSIVPQQAEKEVASTETITANLYIKGEDATAAGLTILESAFGKGAKAYMSNPAVPPTSPVEKTGTLTTYTDGTMSVTVQIQNDVFTLQKLGTCGGIEDATTTQKDGVFGAMTGRVATVTIPVTGKQGTYVFKDCEVYPTPLGQTFTVPMTLEYGTGAAAEKTTISSATVSGIADATYTGSAIMQPTLKVAVGGSTLVEGRDYTVTYTNNVNLGTATITITGIGSYKDTVTKTFTIAKAVQTVKVKVTSKSYKYTSMQKKAASFKIGASASGKVTYKVTSCPKNGKKYITVSKAGKVTMKKKAPAGTYEITVSAAETTTKAAATKTVTVKVTKDKQKITAKISTKTHKAKSLAKKKATYSIGAKAKGKLIYKVTSYPTNAKKYISVSKKGKVTMKKGAPKGTYKIQITAAATARYKKATKTVKIVVK